MDTIDRVLADLDETLKTMSIDELVALSAEKQAEEKAAAAVREKTNKRLVTLMTDMGFNVGQAYVREDGIGATLQTRKTPDRIDRTQLIAHNVDPEVVDACTIFGSDSKPFVVIRVPSARPTSEAGS